MARAMECGVTGELFASLRVEVLTDRVIAFGEVPLGDCAPAVVLGRFQLDRVLGRGTYGAVFAAHDRKLERAVALKVFDAEAEALHEAQVLARVHHPNVIVLHDIGHDRGFHYLVLALVDGGTMIEHVRTGLDWGSIVDLFVQVGRGLAAVHWADIVHGDVKPGNMLVGRDGRACLADFGVAESLIPGGQPTNSGRPRGTLPYMAPECRDGGEIGPCSDQFSFCLSLWEALFGQLGSEPSGFNPAKFPPARGVPTQLEQVIRRGLSERPRDRFPDMPELVDALLAIARPLCSSEP